MAVALLAIAFVAIASRAPAASAHASLESSSPERGEVVPEMPSTIELVFSQDVARSGGLPEAIVVNDSGDQVDLGATLNDDNRRLITIDMPPAMPDGRYTVIWHTLSDEDGEEARGAFDFYVGSAPTGAPAPPEQTPSATSTPAPPDSDTPAPTEPPPQTEPPASGGAGTESGDSGGIPLWGLIGGIAAGAAAGFAGGLAAAGRRGKAEL